SVSYGPGRDQPRNARPCTGTRAGSVRCAVVCDELADAAVGGADPGKLTEVFAQLVGKRIVLNAPSEAAARTLRAA
ncbi:MAG: hypothetical protein ACREX8_02370, partial [Gammaproteobacteria bacterium]